VCGSSVHQPHLVIRMVRREERCQPLLAARRPQKGVPEEGQYSM